MAVQLENIQATEPERMVYNELTRLGIGFDFQSSFYGGRLQRGGLIVDFYIPDRNLAINIQSFYWHYSIPDRIVQDRMQQVEMESQGISIIYIDEEDVRSNVRYYVAEALEGIDHSMMAGG